MAVTMIFGLLCIAGMAFMICFLVALSRDGRSEPRCRVIYMGLRPSDTEENFPRLASPAGTALRSDANSRLGLKVIAGRAERPFRRVG